MNIAESLRKYPIFEIVSKVADDNDIICFAIGGFVRDVILSREVYDIDIVCLQRGLFLAEEVARRVNSPKIAVYKNFGTAMFMYEGLKIEFVQARKESYNHNSRNPIVNEGTFEDDQLRRDFTINTLAVGLNKGNFGEVVNYLHGLEDLDKKIIRTPVDPDTTFDDDPLRMLRAIRFASQLHFSIEKNTFEGIKRKCERIKIISPERVRDELNKILLSEKPSVGFNLLSKAGLLSLILPEIEALKGQERINNLSHKDIFLHTLQVLDNVAEKSDNLWLRWTALLHDVAKPYTKRFDPACGFSFHGHEEIGARWVKRIFTRLFIPKDKISYVEKLIRLHLRPIIIAQDVVTDSAVRRLAYEAGGDFTDLMILCRADITSKNTEKIDMYLNNFNKVEEKVEYIEKKDHIRNLQPVLTGFHIMQELKLSPGPMVGEIKKKLKEAIINGEIENDYEHLHELMLQIYEHVK